MLVHSDPRFARLEQTFPPHAELRVPVRHTGFVAAERAAPAVRRGDAVVVSAGGGLVGAPLLRAALGAQRTLWSQTGRPMRLIAGPFLPAAERDGLAAAARDVPGATVVPSVPDLGAELDRAAASVSQCGYNTALELIRARVPALVVPYATPEEDEQRRRARRLARLGALRVLAPERLGPDALAAAIRSLAGFTPAPAALDLGGARATAELLWSQRRIAERVA